MKISEMIEREDFFSINKATLGQYYQNNKGKTKLYIYPKLNAIISKYPSRLVKQFLYCEYSIRSNILKRALVKLYLIMCFNSFGHMATDYVIVDDVVENDTLIYPCNKKYRIFHFDSSCVDVIAKQGFDKSDLEHEIDFRTRTQLPDFVPTIIEKTSMGYREQIINGRPLARIVEKYDVYKDTAYRLLQDYAKDMNEQVDSLYYAKSIRKAIERKITNKVRDKNTLIRVIVALQAMIKSQIITITFSHGDLQPGNIWVENDTEKIYIIDWESWGRRSEFYDRAALFEGLRPGKIEDYLNRSVDQTEKAIVLLEDIDFQLHELNSLPNDFGIEKFSAYVDSISFWTK